MGEVWGRKNCKDLFMEFLIDHSEKVAEKLAGPTAKISRSPEISKRPGQTMYIEMQLSLIKGSFMIVNPQKIRCLDAHLNLLSVKSVLNLVRTGLLFRFLALLFPALAEKTSENIFLCGISALPL